MAVDRSKVERLAAEGHRPASSALRALRTLSFQLSGAQLGITITSLVVGFLIEPTIAEPLEPLLARVAFIPENSSLAISVGLALALATATEMVVAELVPKNFAISRPLATAFAVSTPLRWYNTLFKPLIVFLNSSANRTVKTLGIEPQEELTSVRSLEELQLLIRASREEGALDAEDASLLSRTITFFSGKTVGDALVPRVSVVALNKDDTVARLADVALESGHSRFPVVATDLDDIVGVAHAKDTFRVPASKRTETRVSDIMHAPLVVPESRSLESLLAEMRRERKHLAIVIDEYGGTAGIVTLEDVLEQILGDIEDEYDEQRGADLTSPPEGVYVLSGMAHPDEVAETTGLDVPDGDYDTLAGFLLTLFDRIPEQGDHVSYDGWELKVVEMDGKRISRVLLVAPREIASEADAP